MTDEITLDTPETRLERFLAAAAGVEGITLDEPETRIERYLYKIAQSGGGSGGGVLVVTDTDDALDKTWQEIHDAFPLVYLSTDITKLQITGIAQPAIESDPYIVVVWDGETETLYSTASASGYPVRE